MSAYVEALQKSHFNLQAEVFDLEDVLSKKEKELYELQGSKNNERIKNTKIASFFNNDDVERTLSSKDI